MGRLVVFIRLMAVPVARLALLVNNNHLKRFFDLFRVSLAKNGDFHASGKEERGVVERWW